MPNSVADQPEYTACQQRNREKFLLPPEFSVFSPQKIPQQESSGEYTIAAQSTIIASQPDFPAKFPHLPNGSPILASIFPQPLTGKSLCLRRAISEHPNQSDQHPHPVESADQRIKPKEASACRRSTRGLRFHNSFSMRHSSCLSHHEQALKSDLSSTRQNSVERGLGHLVCHQLSRSGCRHLVTFVLQQMSPLR